MLVPNLSINFTFKLLRSPRMVWTRWWISSISFSVFRLRWPKAVKMSSVDSMRKVSLPKEHRTEWPIRQALLAHQTTIIIPCVCPPILSSIPLVWWCSKRICWYSADRRTPHEFPRLLFLTSSSRSRENCDEKSNLEDPLCQRPTTSVDETNSKKENSSKERFGSFCTDERNQIWRKKRCMFCAGVEPATFCVLSRCDNRYTNRTCSFITHIPK